MVVGWWSGGVGGVGVLHEMTRDSRLEAVAVTVAATVAVAVAF